MNLNDLKRLHENFVALQKAYTDKYVGKEMKMYIGDTETANKTYKVLKFDIYATSHNSPVGHLIKMANSFDEVATIADSVDDFNLRPSFLNGNGKEEYIKFSRFVQANRVGL
jgi:hypothetical protein